MTVAAAGAVELVARVLESHTPSVARAITLLESRRPGSDELRERLWAAGGRARVIGVTGAPGSGKSTLVAAMATELRRRERTVAIVAVDPASAVSGGAILGDRIRMADIAPDPGVFVRSMSNRGSLGGLSRATVDAVAVLDAGGWDDVIVETVGVGQAEVDVVQLAQTILVVSVPGLGDDVQALKAGLMEIADIHVVNKADRADANRTVAELKSMLTLAHGSGHPAWDVPVLETVAPQDRGTAELIDAVDAHTSWLAGSAEGDRRRRASIEARVREIVKELVVEALHDPTAGADFDDVVGRIAARSLSPHAAARRLMAELAATSRHTRGAAR